MPAIWKDAWEPLPQIPVGELKQGVSSAAVTSGSPAPGAVPRREGAALCRTAPSGAFPTGIPSPACRRRRIYGYAVRTTSTPRGKSSWLQPHLAYPEINLPCFILPSGHELIPSSGKDISQSCSHKRLMCSCHRESFTDILKSLQINMILHLIPPLK